MSLHSVCPEAVVSLPARSSLLVGVATAPPAATDTAVVVIVGGPQYRVGSHRQFVQLSRALGAAGYPSLRFDVAGMGDSAGAPPHFEALDDDVQAAIDGAFRRWPHLKRVVLWGLCDGASAALLYCRRRSDPRLGGLCLVNPWLRSEASLARTHVKHYYLERLSKRDFWVKLLSGKVAFRAATELAANVFRSVRSDANGAAVSNDFRVLMAEGLRTFNGPVLLCISGDDLTANEFVDGAAAHPAWKGALDRVGIERRDFIHADHTFSVRCERLQMEEVVVNWLVRSFDAIVTSTKESTV